jgi:hypothetical protein
MVSCTIRICMVWCFLVFLSFIEGTRERDFEREKVLACCVCGIDDGYALC